MSSPLLALCAFALAASATPGPNNAMAAASAANHGLRATLPMVLGIASGFALMLAVVGLGVAGVLAATPVLAQALRIVSLLWLLWLAVQIARAGAPGQGPARPPLGFWGGAAFQWVNPKAWFIALGASAAFVIPGQAMAPQVARVAVVFFVIAAPSVLAWAALGGAAGRLLQRPARLRAFNIGMAVLMVASMLPVAVEMARGE